MPASRTLDSQAIQSLLAPLGSRVVPVQQRPWQPTSTLYGGGHLFREGTLDKLRGLARSFVRDRVPTAATLADVFVLPEGLATLVYARLLEKMAADPLEDVRIDFEDGYGIRDEPEEARDAEVAALALAEDVRVGRSPRRVGIRIKPLSGSMGARSLSTLDGFLSAFVGAGVALPEEFVITLPKVTSEDECRVLSEALSLLENRLGLPRIACELMVETREAIFRGDGSLAPPALVRATEGRCVGLHMGSYDLTASLDVSAHHQRMGHPFCELARLALKMSAPVNVDVSDGATVELPLAVHRGAELSALEIAENDRAIRGALRAHARNVTESLERGIYQGWDLHPAQLVARYVATYAFFLASREPMTVRLTNFLNAAGNATRVGTKFDDMATGEGLYRFFRRGLSCGALTAEDARATGLTTTHTTTLAEALRGRA